MRSIVERYDGFDTGGKHITDLASPICKSKAHLGATVGLEIGGLRVFLALLTVFECLDYMSEDASLLAESSRLKCDTFDDIEEAEIVCLCIKAFQRHFARALA